MRKMTPKNIYASMPYCIRSRFSQRMVLRLLVLFAVGAFLIFQGILLLRIKEENVSDGVKSVRGNSSGRSAATGGKYLGTKILGITSAAEMQFYVPDAAQMFSCLKTGKKIPFEQVNDDYCDCEEDGSDEPSTGACPDTVFACQGSQLVIQGSRVNDFICDCCGGEDEWKMGLPINLEFEPLSKSAQLKLNKFQAPCENRC